MRESLIYINNKYKHSLIGAEIGVGKGLNAEDIIKNMNIKKLYLIDPYVSHPSLYINVSPLPGRKLTLPISQVEMDNNYNEMFNRMKSYLDKIEIIKDYSINVAKRFKDKELDFVYIDGNHNYKFVMNDLNAWFSKVKYVLCGHNFEHFFPDVKKAVNEFVKINKLNFTIEGSDWRINVYHNISRN